MTRARDLANLIGSGNYTSTTFTATAGQTVFTIAHTPNFIQVFMNGLLLDETTDYTSNGTAVTLTSSATAGDELEVVKYNTFSVGDAITQTAADSRYVNTTGDTMTGTLDVGGVIRNTNGLRIGASNAGTGYGLRIGASGATDPLEIWRDHANGDQMQLSVDYYGRVTMPYQPAFHAYINSANPSFGSSLTKIPFNGTRFNIGNHFDTTNQRFVAPVAGRYHFTVSHNVYNVDVGNWWRTYWFLNGGTYKPGAYMYSDGTGDQTLESALTFNLSANDYVEVYTQSNDGSYSGSAGTVWNAFCGHLIG